MVHKEVIRKARFIHLFMFFAYILVFIAAIALADKSSFNWLPDTFGFVQLVISAVFGIGVVFGSKSIANTVFARKEVLENPEKLNASYLSWNLIRIAMSEMAGLLASIGFLLTANLLLLIIAILMGLVIFNYRPTFQKATELITEAQSAHSSK